MNKYLDLAKKLKALADQGVGGEKINAEQKLNDLMEKHGLTMDDIEGIEVFDCYFKVKKEDQSLFQQVASSVLGDVKIYCLKRDRGVLVIETTIALRMEIELKFDFYLKAYKEQLKVFYRAFVDVNKLYPKDSKGKELNELTAEELEVIQKAKLLSLGMSAEKFQKRLKN